MGALIATKISCPACGHSASRVRFAVSSYSFRACGGCGLIYAWPRPTAEDLDAVYAQSYFDDRGWLGDPTSDSSYMTRCWREVSPVLHRRFPGCGRLLDVGCATGAFIAAAANDGWQVAGLEFSEQAAARARDAGLDVRAGTVHDAAFAGERFDVITAWHVIEHLIFPIDDLRAMRACARPRAVLVLETPNARSIGAALRGSKWSQARPPEHINFFDRVALARALSASGWRMREARTIYKRDTAERIAGRRWLAPAARAAARAAEAAGMGGNLRAIAEAV